jgi:membrane associated rhomboid family serine protease
VSTGGPDLFVVCKSCHSEVSPYITECPYCGARLRKRAPKLDREGRIAERPRRGARRTTRRSAPRPSLGRLRAGEIPGIRGEETRPWVTLAFVVASLVLLVLARTTLDIRALWVGQPPFAAEDPYRFFTSPFVYFNTGYAFVAVGGIALFGWLLERRHGPLVPLVLALLGGAGGMALSAAVGSPLLAVGGNGIALAMVVAWAAPDVLAWRRGEEPGGDLLGAVVFAVVIAALPAFVPDEADWLVAAGGLLAGLLVGVPLALRSGRP